ncbi:MAG: hypothetical protein ACXWPM_06980 [Bdellovibrionota bacterium]
MRKTLSALLLAIFLTCLTPSQAHAFGFDVSAVGAGTYSSGIVTPAPGSMTAGFGYGAGGLVGFSFIPILGIQSGALWLNHSFTLNGVSNSYNYLNIPFMARLMFFSIFSIEAGGYYGILLNGTPTANNDIGLMGGASVFIPLGVPFIKIRISAYYEYGLTNIAPSGSTIASRNIDLLAGLGFVF